MDWLRIGAFLLLILYHVGLAFGPWKFEIKVALPQDWVTIPLLALNAWRLPLLFVVSGFASAALLARSASVGGFAGERLRRLGIPLLFAMIVLVTPQPWIALVTQHGYPHGFGYFLANDYFGFHEIDGVKVPTWMHLWFVAYLLVYTLILGAILRWARGPARTGARWAERAFSGVGLIVWPIVYFFAVRELLPPGWVETHGLVDDWSAHAIYAASFLFGFLLNRSAVVRAAVDRWWGVALALAIVALAIVVAVEVGWPGNTPLPDSLTKPYLAVRAVQLWTTVIALIGIANRFLDRDSPRWRQMLAEAVFPVYIIHQTIILVVGYWLLPTPTGTLARFLILIVATAGGSFLFYHVGREIGWLRPLIGLRRKPAARPVEATA